MPSDNEEKKYFTHCGCDKCNKMSDVLEDLLAALHKAEEQAMEVDDHTPFVFVVASITTILENMFHGSVYGSRMASASASALYDFISGDATVQQLRSDVLDAVFDSFSGLKGVSDGVPVFSVPLEETPEELRTILESIIASRVKGGGQNYH